MSTQSALPAPEPVIPEDTIANRLVLARKVAGNLSAREAAMRCGIGRGTWQNWEHGHPTPRLDDLRTIAEVLGVSFTWLVEGGPLSDPRTHGGDNDNNRRARSDSNGRPSAYSVDLRGVPVHRPSRSVATVGVFVPRAA